MRDRTGVLWLREDYDVALESMDCDAEVVVVRVLAQSESHAREIARRRQEEPERWCVVDVRKVYVPLARGAA